MNRPFSTHPRIKVLEIRASNSIQFGAETVNDRAKSRASASGSDRMLTRRDRR